MCKKENIKRLEKIINLINQIDQICKEAGSISKALDDTLRDRPAIFMFFININEEMSKVLDSFDKDIIIKFDESDIRGLRGVRNVITHNYDGVDLDIIKDSICYDLPRLKEKIINILSDTNS